MDQLLPGFDREVSEYLRRSMERRGAKIFLSSTVNEIKISNDKVKAIVNTKDGIKEIEVEIRCCDYRCRTRRVCSCYKIRSTW
jgi:dihydrolipoamide dehydrogenase